MATKYLLKKDHLKPFLRKLTKEHRLVAPLKNRHGDTMFNPVADLDREEVDLDNQAQNSIKPFFFPQTEAICDYRAESSDSYRFQEVELQREPTIFFGVRPCDLSAILYMDVIFLRDVRDPFYQRRREVSVLIGLNCNQPFPNCFCNATKSGPHQEFGFDLQFTDLGDRFLVEVGRAKGEELINRWQQFFTPAEPQDSQAQYQALLEARGSFPRQIHVDQAIKRLREGEIGPKIWEFLSQRCQDCGGCAYVCPTCTCFTITDQPESGGNVLAHQRSEYQFRTSERLQGTEDTRQRPVHYTSVCEQADNDVDSVHCEGLFPTGGQRIRSWDACTFSGFTRMAGDHNPVRRQDSAIRQRFLHKLLYDVEKHGRPSCVGCGRCVEICFGGTDIVRFINLVGQEQ